MNPFDLNGPAFLVFYTAVGALTLLALVLIRHQREAGGAPVRLTDPYLIACLRGGPNEVLRVATVALVDRGLLVADGSTLHRAEAASSERVRHPVEQALLEKFETEGEAAGVFSDPALGAATRELENTLARQRLLPDPAVRRERARLALLGAAFLGTLALIKLFVALSRGRKNVLFLLLLAAAFTVAAFLVSVPRLTQAGSDVLADLRTLFGGLRDRRLSLSPGQSDEVALLAAVYGIEMLPHGDWAYARKLYPKANDASRDCGAGCGASSSSGDSSCGSSCGGGGGGGGCGGCGS